MKMRTEHYAQILSAMRELAKSKPDITPASYAKAGIGNDTDMRFRWDAFRACQINGDSIRWQCDVLYPYLNDQHVDTALRAAVSAAYGA